MLHGPRLWKAMLRVASLPVPGARRADWLQEWSAELCEVRRAYGVTGQQSAQKITTFCGGAFRDALTLRTYDLRSQWGPRLEAGKPLRVTCLLLVLLFASLLCSVIVPSVREEAWVRRSGPADALRLLSREGSFGTEQPTIRYEDYRAWASSADPRLRELAFYRNMDVPVYITSAPLGRYSVAYANAATRKLLQSGVRTAAPGATPVALLSQRLWQHAFHSNPSAIGQTIFVDAEPVTIAGVAPQASWPLPGRMDIVLIEPEAELARRLSHATGYLLAPWIEPALRVQARDRPYLLMNDAAGGQQRVECLSLGQRRHDPFHLFLFALLLACLALPALTPLPLGEYPPDPHSRTARLWLRRWSFLAGKIMLVVPTLFLSPLAITCCVTTQGTDAAAYLQLTLTFVASLVALRWALHDQRRRCPACLRLLSHPALVGHCSHSLLAWSGTELLCTGGHGFLHVPEHPTSWFDTQRWLPVDSTWAELFSGV